MAGNLSGEIEKTMKAVCVTGGGGYIASWLVKRLLSSGYLVHATVRDPSDEKKTAHLKQLPGASNNLKIFKVDLLNYDAVAAAVDGCEGVFHVASPVPAATMVDPEVEVLGPAVKGTLNVLKASSEAKVQRVVVVSSMVAVEITKSWPIDKINDESCWSDKELCRKMEEWYSVSKITAEETALEFGKERGLDVVTLCPSLVFGPQLQPTVNTSSQFLVYMMKGGPDAVQNKLWHLVDVRDVAEALVLIFEKHEAQGRYICAPHYITTADLVKLLKRLYPNFPYAFSVYDVEHPAPMSCDKLKKLGWEYMTLEDMLKDHVEYCQKEGLLDGNTAWRCPPVYNKI